MRCVRAHIMRFMHEHRPFYQHIWPCKSDLHFNALARQTSPELQRLPLHLCNIQCLKRMASSSDLANDLQRISTAWPVAMHDTRTARARAYVCLHQGCVLFGSFAWAPVL